MSQDEIRKLVGGYATGTLTEAERKALFDAALDDQDLFDELAREQSLKELLDSPGARTRLTAVLAPPEPKWSANRFRFAIGGVLAAGFAIALGVVLVVRKPHTDDFAAVTKTESRPAIEEPSKVVPNAVTAPQAGAPAAAAPQPVNQPTTQSASNNIAPIRPPVLLQPPPEDALKKTESARRDEPSKPAGPAPDDRSPSAKALGDEKDAAPQQKAQTAQVAESVTVQTETAQVQTQALPLQQGPSGLARQQAAQAPKTAPAAPPPAVATNGAIGGLVAGRTAAFAARPAPTRFAFDYTIRRDSLTVNPRAAGFLRVTAAVLGGQQIILQQASRQEAGTSVTMPIPAGSLNLTIEFSRPEIPDVAASLDNLQNRGFREKTAAPRANAPATPAPVSKDKTGHVEEQTPSPNPRLTITVAVPSD